jgi:hypothetical protein
MEGTIDLRLNQAMADHLRECQICSTLVTEVRDLRQSLTAFPQIGMPPKLVERILDKTSGRPKKRSFWRDMVLPTLRPFLTQRYAFGTGIMLVFISLLISLLGPGFSTLGASDLSPSGVAENADRLTDRVRMRWVQVQSYEKRAVEELRLIKDDLSGRLDYYLVNMLFRSYRESVQEKQNTAATTPPNSSNNSSKNDKQ